MEDTDRLNKVKSLLNITFKLHNEQIKVLTSVVVEKKDCFAVLPTGFGKSLIYQLLPFYYDEVFGDNSCVIVISPLNAIIEDQVYKLSSAFQATVIRRNAKVDRATLTNSKLIFGHAESFVDDQEFRSILREDDIKRRVKAIVVDEAHFVVQWKTFRPAYANLSTLGSLFPNVPVLALTATANTSYLTEIKESLSLNAPVIIKANPDRPNLFLEVKQRPSSGDDKICGPLADVVQELKEKREKTPRTIVYGSLEVCGECYAYFDGEMGTNQYHPLGASEVFTNRLFAQYHANYPSKYKDALIQSLTDGTCIARVIFVTVAFGVGVDCKDVKRVIHIGLPCTMEDYFQELGRAGRAGSNGLCTLYYNSYDISKARKELTPVMKEYVLTTSCRRAIILKHFEEEPLLASSHKCCDNCAMSCSCDDCVCIRELDKAHVQPVSLAASTSSQQTTLEESNLDNIDKLRNKLEQLRMSLSPDPTSLGISLTTGFSVNLIDEVVAKYNLLNSVDDVHEQLPVFSRGHAVKIWDIVKNFKS